ncbi:Ig-like domain-containing protein [Paludisphaera mucosa]|uniref:Ig-like domain-containing protein n=1 Tax=Paludisphaera mucosa TaxID=3030827 RepID=A0ABT6FIR2_9BACT|nr:Ig-like domain-containing protein [Paludisphaera mucosa]MDG3007258.1 Ig-like domain-containing protein [Paludisphaera mucosa]
MLYKAPFAVVKPRRRPSRPPVFEVLEDRTVLSTVADFESGFALGGQGAVTIREAAGTDGPWVVGSFTGTIDFDPGEGVFALTSAGGEDAFLASYDRMGRLRWARSFGGPGDDRINDVKLDDRHFGLNQQYIVVVGAFSGSVEFGPGYGTTLLTSEGGTDAFLAQFAVADGSLHWARGFGGPGDDEATGLALAWDHLFVVGSFRGTANFDPGLRLAGSPRTMTSAGGADVFYVDLARDGSWWYSSAARAGGPGDDGAVAASESRILGTFEGTADLSFGDGIDLRWISEGPMLRTSAGGRDGFVVTFWGVGDPRTLRTFGGPGDDRPTDLAEIDYRYTTPPRPSYYYISGAFEGRVDFGGPDGAGIRTSAGGADGFLARYDESTDALDWVAAAGGQGDDAVEAITAHVLSVWATGGFTGDVDFDPGAGVRTLRDAGRGSAFLWCLEPSGKVELARSMGGDGASWGVGLPTLNFKSFVLGRFEGAVDVDPSPTGSRVLTSIGRSAAFVAKFVDTPDMIPIAVDDMYRVEAGGVLTVWPTPGPRIGLLANDFARVGSGFVTMGTVSDLRHGSISTGYQGEFRYTPSAGFVGTDSFTYQVHDGDLASNVATVYFTVVEPGEGPPPESPALYLEGEGRGVWTWSAAGFHQINTDDPEAIAASADGTLFLDFGPRGLWFWSEGAYRKLNDADPQTIAAGPGGSLAVDYGSFGLWIGNGWIRPINAADPEGLAFGPDGTLFIDYGPYGLWRWREGYGFRQLNAANPEGLAGGPGGVLYVDYGVYGLWDWRDGSGFRQLNSGNPQALAASPDGSLYLDFGPYGLWRRDRDAVLTKLDSDDPREIMVDLVGALVVDLGPRGLFRWADGGFEPLAAVWDLDAGA